MARDRRPEPAPAPDDWRVYRPAIWAAMLGIALALLISPGYICALPLGAALGIALKIHGARAAATLSARGRRVCRDKSAGGPWIWRKIEVLRAPGTNPNGR